MEREIKFRAWDTASKRFIDHVFLNAIGEAYIDCDPHGIDMSGRRKIAMTAPERLKIDWWTGYSDSNGTLVFDSDIYTFDYEYDAYYDGDMPIVKRSSGTTTGAMNRGTISEAQMEGGKVLVIGNIYQHPEILTH